MRKGQQMTLIIYWKENIQDGYTKEVFYIDPAEADAIKQPYYDRYNNDEIVALRIEYTE